MFLEALCELSEKSHIYINILERAAMNSKQKSFWQRADLIRSLAE